jgi:hypothetical protein
MISVIVFSPASYLRQKFDKGLRDGPSSWEGGGFAFKGFIADST